MAETIGNILENVGKKYLLKRLFGEQRGRDLYKTITIIEQMGLRASTTDKYDELTISENNQEGRTFRLEGDHLGLIVLLREIKRVENAYTGILNSLREAA